MNVETASGVGRPRLFNGTIRKGAANLFEDSPLRFFCPKNAARHFLCRRFSFI
jgi:hypothetical protein